MRSPTIVFSMVWREERLFKLVKWGYRHCYTSLPSLRVTPYGGSVTPRGSKVQIQGMQEQIILMLKEDAFIHVDPDFAGSLLTCLFVLPRLRDFKNLNFSH